MGEDLRPHCPQNHWSPQAHRGPYSRTASTPASGISRTATTMAVSFGCTSRWVLADPTNAVLKLAVLHPSNFKQTCCLLRSIELVRKDIHGKQAWCSVTGSRAVAECPFASPPPPLGAVFDISELPLASKGYMGVNLIAVANWVRYGKGPNSRVHGAWRGMSCAPLQHLLLLAPWWGGSG